MITYPSAYSEFEIQASIYCALIAVGLDVRGEVKCKPCRFDLVVYKNKEAVCIIEVKKWRKKTEPTKTKQFIKYSSYNLPLFYCGYMADVTKVCSDVLSIVR